tara:strand:- start:350 stop:502 length:153 start_codon:yes stop_codon:yes gene_type:complete
MVVEAAIEIAPPDSQNIFAGEAQLIKTTVAFESVENAPPILNINCAFETP